MGLPPGPLELPMVGSASFFLDSMLLRQPVPDVLLKYRNQYGPLFTFKTGPIRHLWASGELADELLMRPEAGGRFEHKDPPFGDQFLFTVSDAMKAAPIRATQHAWLQKNVGPAQVAAAVAEVEPAIAEAFDEARRQGGFWPGKRLGQILLGAMLRVFVGTPSGQLDDEELQRLILAAKGYRMNPVKRQSGGSGLFKPSAPDWDYAGEIRGLLLEALTRSERPESELPLLVSACVGGAEIFPLIFEWIMRRVSMEPDIQKKLRVENAALAKKGGAPFGPMTASVVSEAMRHCPYSSAIGPPRKLLDDISLPARDGLPEGATLPKGALLFAMQPGFTDSQIAREWGDFPALKANQSNWTRAEQLDHERMFGRGERSCLSEDFALVFLNAVLATVMKHFRVLGPGPELMAASKARHEQPKPLRASLFAFKSDGAFLVPAEDLPLTYLRLTLADPLAPPAMNYGKLECRRRALRALEEEQAAPEDEAGWLEAWRERLGCWLMGLPGPTQTQLGSCMGALGLHIGSRLDSALNRPPAAAATRQPEQGCEWLKEGGASTLTLPTFPQFPPSFKWHLPPIPSLLPRPDELLQLRSEADGQLADLVAGLTPTEPSTASHAALPSAYTPAASRATGGGAAAVGAGAGAGFVAALAFLGAGRLLTRRRIGRDSRQSRQHPTVPAASPETLVEVQMSR